MLATILAGILMLIVVVIIHEGGHALAARLCGVGVAEFGVGFWSPRIKLFTFRKIPIYLCLWLLGGYVKLKSQADKKSHGAEGRFIEDAALWQKILILLAGVSANLISAVLLRMILFAACPEGFTFKFLFSTATLAAAPAWYLIPIYAVKSVFYLFWFWSKVMAVGIFLFIFWLIKNILFMSPMEHSGAIATIGLASAIHTGFWDYVATIWYFSIILAVMNLLPIYPLDGGNIALEILKKVIRRLFGEGRVYDWSITIYTYLGQFIIALFFLNMLMSDIGDIATFFRR